MNKVCIALLLILQSIAVFGLTPRQCIGSSIPPPLTLNVVGCAQEPCNAINGADITFTMTFNTIRATTTLEAAAQAFLLDLPLPYDVPEAKRNACNVGLLNAACPLTSGQHIEYQLSGVPVEAPISGVTVSLEFSLIDDTEQLQVCTRLNFRITAP